MPNLPVRGLGNIGVISDVSPYDLPLGAWSDARNVRFTPAGVTRSPVFKPFVLKQDFKSPPVHVVDDSLRLNSKSISTIRQDGTITRISSGVVSDASPQTALGPLTENLTGTLAGSVSYINTGTTEPISIATGEAQYSKIPNWTSGDRCVALRGFRDFLIALNVTKTGLSYPNMVKWSDAITAGVRPRWDVSLEDGLAGENVLNESTGYIVDGRELAGSFLIYGSKEVFRMDYVGEPFVFSFTKLFGDVRVMTQNCVVEVNSKHFVFCDNDIIVTDGVSKESICANKIRDRVFSNILQDGRSRCRVIHNPINSEVIFAYPSAVGSWSSGDLGCNEAAVYNYDNETWSFIDLPNVTSGYVTETPEGSLGVALSWEGLAQWSDLKSPWNTNHTLSSCLIMTSAGDSDSGLGSNVFFYDHHTQGSISNDVEPLTLQPAFAEMHINDFDEVGFPLLSTKLIRTLTPQVEIPDSLGEVYFYLEGTKGTKGTNPSNAHLAFSPYEQDKLNSRVNGRYITFRFEIPKGIDVSLSGFDLDIVQVAGR